MIRLLTPSKKKEGETIHFSFPVNYINNMTLNNNIISKRIEKQNIQKRQSKNIVRKLIEAEKIIPSFLLHKTVTKSSLLHTIKKIKNCGSHANFKTSDILITHKDNPPRTEQKTKLFETNFCNTPIICPICAERYARKKYAEMKPHIENLIKKYKYVYFCTFTTPDNFDFNINYNQLNNALRKFFLMGQLRQSGQRSGGEAAKIRAAIISKEIKKGKKSKTYHIHAHSILFCDKKLDYSIYRTAEKNLFVKWYKDQNGRSPGKEELKQFYKKTIMFNGSLAPVSKFTNDWHIATNKTALNCDIRPLFTPDLTAAAKSGKELKGILDKLNATIRELIKYPAKINDFLPDEILDILINRKGKRMFSTTGDLYKLTGDKAEIAEEELFVSDIQGYNYNHKTEQLEPLEEKEKRRLWDTVFNPQPYNEYKKIVLENYRLSERIKKYIFALYTREEVKRPESIKEIREKAIRLIDKVSAEYNAMKKAYYKKIIEGEKIEILPFSMPPCDIFKQ